MRRDDAQLLRLVHAYQVRINTYTYLPELLLNRTCSESLLSLQYAIPDTSFPFPVSPPDLAPEPKNWSSFGRYRVGWHIAGRWRGDGGGEVIERADTKMWGSPRRKQGYVRKLSYKQLFVLP